jgi:phosphate transport system substrate-binding protein
MSMKMAAAVLAAATAFVGCTRTDGGGSAGEPAGSASSSAATTTATSKSAIQLKGSDTMVILGQRWAESFMKDHPQVSVQVTGGGSGTGIAALINGTTDICQASRPMKDKEKEDVKAKRSQPAVEQKVALDALAIYVNEKNTMTEISMTDLARIYKGEVTSFKDVGGPAQKIVLYGRENNSGTYGYFKEHVLENKDFAPATQTLAGTSAVVAAVKGDVGGIGYGGIAYAEGVHALSVKKDASGAAVKPSLETAQKGTYPLSRFLYFYTAGEPAGASKTFIDWVKSDAGQKVIEQVGYYPLPKE